LPEFSESNRKEKGMLYNILKAYSIYDEKVGYCQGMNYLAAMLIYIVKNEERAFLILMHIMYNQDWRLTYMEGMEKLMSLVKWFSKEVKYRVPNVYNHLKQLEIDFYGVFSHIFLSAFIYKTPIELAIRIFDIFLIDKEKGLIACGINMLNIMQNKIISYNSIVNLYIIYK